MAIKQKATDIYLDSGKPYQKRLGDLLFAHFVANRRELGIEYVVWNRRVSEGEEIFAYPRTQAKKLECDSLGKYKRYSCYHRDHLHVEFDRHEGDKDHSCLLRHVVAQVQKAMATSQP